MSIGDKAKKKGIVAVFIGLFGATTALGWFQVALPLIQEYRSGIRAQEAAEREALQEAERERRAQERFEADQAERRRIAEIEAKARRDEEKLRRDFQIEENRKLRAELKANRKITQEFIDEQRSRYEAEVARRVENETKLPEVAIENNKTTPKPLEKIESAKLDKVPSTKSFPVYGSEQFSLCGHDQFRSYRSSGYVRFENVNRNFTLRTGIRNWEKTLPVNETSELIPGCAVTVKERTSEKVNYLIISETTYVNAGE